jgi:hypothetical protein
LIIENIAAAGRAEMKNSEEFLMTYKAPAVRHLFAAI